MGRKLVDRNRSQAELEAGPLHESVHTLELDSDEPMDTMEEYGLGWKLQECVNSMIAYQPKMSNLHNIDNKDQMKVSITRRNQSAHNLKCLTAFYGYSPEIFCLALSTLDRFITKVKVQPRYLSCVTTTCFYHAVKVTHGAKNAPCLEKLIRVSQCDCRCGDIQRMENIICDKLRPPANRDTITALTVLQVMVDTFADLSHIDVSSHLDKMSSKLVMLLCHAELAGESATMLAFATFRHHLDALELEQPATLHQLLNICQINERDFAVFYNEVASFLTNSYAAPSSIPRLALKWTISNRTMSRLRPGYYGDTDLPVIHETPFDCCEYQTCSASTESLEMEEEDALPGTPTPEDFSHHFSYPNSPSEPSPLSAGLPPCPLITYADVVSGRIYASN